MATSNPAFSNSPAFTQSASKAIQLSQTPSAEQLDEMYGRPAATAEQTDRMSYENTMQKIVGSFAVLLLGAAVGWFVPILALPAAIAGFVVALVLIFKKKPSPGLTLAYAALEGIFVGGISVIFEGIAPGVASQAVIATLVIIGVVLALFRSGKIRSSKRATKVFLIAMIGYAVFSLINMGLILFGVNQDPWGLRGGEIFGIPVALLLGVLVILLASYSLVLDFESIKTGVERGAPAAFGWQAAFGIMVTVVWLYVEILRMLAILRGGE